MQGQTFSELFIRTKLFYFAGFSIKFPYVSKGRQFSEKKTGLVKGPGASFEGFKFFSPCIPANKVRPLRPSVNLVPTYDIFRRARPIDQTKPSTFCSPKTSLA